ncbi:MAG: hypothetical protein Q4B14_03430 [Clostridia bacterium]|nr:hypothetical protein [Clostridia bacterium]
MLISFACVDNDAGLADILLKERVSIYDVQKDTQIFFCVSFLLP